jgi:hypothetical protein
MWQSYMRGNNVLPSSIIYGLTWAGDHHIDFAAYESKYSSLDACLESQNYHNTCVTFHITQDSYNTRHQNNCI